MEPLQTCWFHEKSVLSEQPTTDIVISVSSPDATEFLVNKSSLVFTSQNWSVPQFVTVTGVDDSRLDGPQSDEITFSIADSTDPFFDGALPIQMPIVNADVEDVLNVVAYPTDDVFHLQVLGGSRFLLTSNGYRYPFESDSLQFSIDGNGGNDVIQVTGSSADETAVLSYQNLEFTGDGYSIEVTNVDRITVNSGGGDDELTMLDSPEDDFVILQPTATWRSSGSNYVAARDFATVVVEAGHGYDVAEFYDSAGDDVFEATPTQATLSGDGFHNTARGFDYTNAYSRSGNDAARLHDSAGDDTFVAKPEVGYLSGSGYFNVARGFHQLEAFARAGNDTAHFYDSIGDDHLVAKSGYSYIYDTAGKFVNVARNFDSINAYSNRGGLNRLELHPNIDAVFSQFGNWELL